MEQRRSELLDHQPDDLLDDLEVYGLSKLLGAIHGTRVKAEALSMLHKGRNDSSTELQNRVLFDATFALHQDIDDVETLAEALVDLYAPERKIPRTRDRRYFAEPQCSGGPEDEG